MGAVEQSEKEKRFWFYFFLAGLISGLILRFYLASFANMPGHGDSAFYYTVAKNIALGRGPVIDYIVYFFSGLLPLPHYAGDFWNPTAAYLIAIPMIIFKNASIHIALIAPILTGIVPAIVGYLAGKKYTGSIGVGALAGVLTFFSPFQVWFSTTTEAIIFSGAFGALAIYFIMKSDDSPRNYLIAATFTGLANLIRQDTILLFGVLGICVLLATIPWRSKLLVVCAAVGIHFLILSPLLIKNYAELGALFPPGPAKTAFLTTYEDFHSYNKEIDWRTLRATFGIRGILTRRLHTAQENLSQVEYFLDPVLEWLLVLSLAELILIRRNPSKLRALLPAFLFAIFEYLFYSLIASYSGPGSLIKSLGILMPFLCIPIVDSFATYLRPKPLLLGAIILLSVYSAYNGFRRNYSSTVYYNNAYEQYKTTRFLLEEDAEKKGISSDNIAIMARPTWDVYEGTGFKTIMIPNNDINTILFVAEHYGAHYILLPADRPQLQKIYDNTVPDPRFHLVASIPDSDLKIFWMDFDP